MNSLAQCADAVTSLRGAEEAYIKLRAVEDIPAESCIFHADGGVAVLFPTERLSSDEFWTALRQSEASYQEEDEQNVDRLISSRDISIEAIEEGLGVPDTPFTNNDEACNSSDNFKPLVANKNSTTVSTQSGSTSNSLGSTDWILESDGDFFVPPKNLFGLEEVPHASVSHTSNLEKSSGQDENLQKASYSIAGSDHTSQTNDPLHLASLPSSVWQHTTTCNLPYSENISLSAQGCVVYVMQGCLRIRNNLSLFAASSLASRIQRPLVVLTFFDEGMLEDLHYHGGTSPATTSSLASVTPQKRSRSDTNRDVPRIAICPVRHAFRRKARIMANLLLSLREQFDQYQIPFLALPYSTNNSSTAILTVLLQENASIIAVFTDTTPHPQPVLSLPHLTSHPSIHKHIPVFDVHQVYTVGAIGDIAYEEGFCPGDVEEVLGSLASCQANLLKTPSSLDPKILIPNQLNNSSVSVTFLSFAHMQSLLPFSSSQEERHRDGYVVTPSPSEGVFDGASLIFEAIDWDYDGSDAYSLFAMQKLIREMQKKPQSDSAALLCGYFNNIYMLGVLSCEELESLYPALPRLPEYIHYYSKALYRLYSMIISKEIAHDGFFLEGNMQWLSLISPSTLSSLAQHKQSLAVSEYLTPLQLRKAATRCDTFNSVQRRLMLSGVLPHPKVWLFYVYYLLVHVEDLQIAIACLLKEAVIYCNASHCLYLHGIAAVIQGVDDVEHKAHQEFNGIDLLSVFAADAEAFMN